MAGKMTMTALNWFTNVINQFDTKNNTYRVRMEIAFKI